MNKIDKTHKMLEMYIPELNIKKLKDVTVTEFKESIGSWMSESMHIVFEDENGNACSLILRRSMPRC